MKEGSKIKKKKVGFLREGTRTVFRQSRFDFCQYFKYGIWDKRFNFTSVSIIKLTATCFFCDFFSKMICFMMHGTVGVFY